MFGNEVQEQDSDSEEECNGDTWLENWYSNVTQLFCPRTSKLIKESRNASLFMNQTVDKNLSKTWNKFVICRVVFLSRKEKKRKKTLPKFQETTWNAICIEVNSR